MQRLVSVMLQKIQTLWNYFSLDSFLPIQGNRYFLEPNDQSPMRQNFGGNATCRDRIYIFKLIYYTMRRLLALFYMYKVCGCCLQVRSVRDRSCDGQILASGSYDRTVCEFSLYKDRLVWIIIATYCGRENVLLKQRILCCITCRMQYLVILLTCVKSVILFVTMCVRVSWCSS